MIRRKPTLAIRKTHRYLGLFIGIQFLAWTVSGLYFSWTDIDEIHGDQFRRIPLKKGIFSNLISLDSISEDIETLSLVNIETFSKVVSPDIQKLFCQTLLSKKK